MSQRNYWSAEQAEGATVSKLMFVSVVILLGLIGGRVRSNRSAVDNWLRK